MLHAVRRPRFGLAAGLILAWHGVIGAGSANAADAPGARPVTFEDAVAHYKGGDMAAANRDFLLLADAGLATADLNLSVMAARGDNGAPDLAEALGWLTAARQLGAEVSEAQLGELSDRVGAEGRSRADAIVSHYGRQAVASRLEDALSACRQHSSASVESAADPPPQSAMTPPRTLEWPADRWGRYPAEGLEKGFPGVVYVRLLIDVDGRGKHPEIAASFPISWREGFQDAASMDLMHGKYAPATLDGRPVAAWKSMKVMFRMVGNEEMIEASAINKLRAATAQGDPAAEALWVVLSDVGVIDYKDRAANRGEDDHILVASALRGFAAAEAVLFERLCVPQHRAVWRIRAASDGAPGVLGPIVRAAYVRVFERPELSEINRLLDKAASSEDPALVRGVAWVRASARDPDLRDSRIALQLALSLHPRQRSDPDYDLALAAAQASGGDFDAARGTQESALRKAVRLGWDVAPLQATLRSYASRQMDSGVPAELQPCTPALESRRESGWTQLCLQH